MSCFLLFFFEKTKTLFEEFFYQLLNKYLHVVLKKNNPKSIGYLERSISAIILSIFIAPTLIFSLYQLNLYLKNELPSDLSSYMVDFNVAQAAAEFVNKRINPDNLVIASPAIAWMIKSNRADFQIPIAYEGNPSIHLPANIPTDRFSYNSDYRTAKFIIVDNIWTDYAIHDNYFIHEMYEDIKNWPVIWSGNKVRVHVNKYFH